MVLVDTSIWIRAFGNRQPYTAHLRQLVLSRRVAGHALVYGELLIGDVGGRRNLLNDYDRLPHASSVDHHDVVAMVRGRRFHGRGASWIDVHLLASALAQKMQLWTADEPLMHLAAELGIAYIPA